MKIKEHQSALRNVWELQTHKTVLILFHPNILFLSMLWLKSWPGGVSGASIAFFHIEGEVRSGTGGAILF